MPDPKEKETTTGNQKPHKPDDSRNNLISIHRCPKGYDGDGDSYCIAERLQGNKRTEDLCIK